MIDKDPAGEEGRVWTVRQTLEDPEGNRDVAIVATVDLDGSDAAGEPVIRTVSFGRLGAAAAGRPPPPASKVNAGSSLPGRGGTRVHLAGGGRPVYRLTTRVNA